MTCQRHYEIAVRDPLGNLTDLITNEYICRWTLRANKVGVLVLELPIEYCSPVSTFSIGSFGQDYRIELRRFIDDTPSLVGSTCFFVNYLAIIQDASGQRRLRVEAESALGLAARRTIAYKSNDNASDLEPLEADSQLHRVMRDHFSSIATSYNTTPSTDPIRTAIAPYITIAAFPGPALSTVDVEMNVAHQPVLQALNQIADASFGKGEPLFFDIQQVSDTANPFLEFVTGVDQLGIDRTVTTGGTNAIVIDTSDSGGSISDYTLSMDWKESAYRVYAGSQGRGEEQVFQTADHAGLAGLITTDPFALREAYIGTNELTTDTQKIIDQAQAELTKLLPKTNIQGTFAENETFQWGVDWDFQDRLTVLSDGLFIDVFVETLDGELSNGEAKITATFSTTLHRSMAGVAKVVQDTKRLEWWVKHLSALEAPAGAGVTPNSITNNDLVQVSTATFKGRTTTGTGDVEDVTAAQVAAALPHIGANIRHTANQSTSNATWLALAFNTELWDTDSYHDTATNNTRITIPAGKSGKYLIVANVAFDVNAAGYRAMQVFKDAATTLGIVNTVAASGNETWLNLSVVYSLSAGDYIELLVFQNSGGSLNLLSNNPYSPEFSVIYLGT